MPDGTCVICAAPLPPRHSVTCSKRCRIRRQNTSEAYRKTKARYRSAGGETWWIACQHCGERARVTKKNARFCSHECADASRVIVPSTELDVWRPPVCRGPGPRWMPRRAPEHPSINGTLFVYGACRWCDERFMALAADWARRSLYCSKRCARNSGRARRGRFSVPPQERQAIYERDNWTCQLCCDPVDPQTTDIWRATLDHIVPQSHTLIPDHSPSNLQLAHLWCNSVKGDERYYTATDLQGQLGDDRQWQALKAAADRHQSAVINAAGPTRRPAKNARPTRRGASAASASSRALTSRGIR